MNSLVESASKTPIEIALGVDENGMTTAKKLYEFLEMDKSHYSRWVKANIVDNEFATENEDYFYSPSMANESNRGKFADDYKLTAHFAKKLSMKGNGEKAEQARQYFITVEDKAKEAAINRSQLSPQMQMFYAIADGQAKMELEQKRQAEQISRIENNQKTMIETFSKSDDSRDFKGWCKKSITKIAESQKFVDGDSRSKKYALAWKESYDRLNEKKPCRIKQRVDRARNDAIRSGATHSQAKEITALSVIMADKALKPLYETVIREMLIYYLT